MSEEYEAYEDWFGLAYVDFKFGDVMAIGRSATFGQALEFVDPVEDDDDDERS